MTMAPLFFKYRAESGNYYVLDATTNEILRISEALYDILDDYHVLDAAEIVAKQCSQSSTRVYDAITELDRLQSRGVLCDHAPLRTSAGNRIMCQGKEQPLKDFMGERRRLLILELTQKCNLQCEYCCYEKYYPRRRQHGEEAMSLETATAAVKDFLDHQPQRSSIGFYGGEPLLEFELLKKIVLFAEKYAGQSGRKPTFSVTTNGTLLTEEKIHFLVEPEFSVSISLDGDKESHDRYRVFRNEQHPEQRAGSYDIVMKNIQRFIELYPQYTSRAIGVTLTATSDLNRINHSLSALQPFFPSINANMVRRPVEYLHGKERERVFGINSCSVFPCQSNSCGNDASIFEDGIDDSRVAVNSSSKDVVPKESQEMPRFCNWTEEWGNAFNLNMADFLDEFCQTPDTALMYRKFPLFMNILSNMLTPLHHRPMHGCAPLLYIPYRCFPGVTRTFCSSGGDLYSCERVPTKTYFHLGDAAKGVNVDRAVHLLEECRGLADCGNCIAGRFCRRCPAAISMLEEPEGPNVIAFQKLCKEEIRGMLKDLSVYTGVMEKNPEAVDQILFKMPKGEDWLDDIAFVASEEQLREIEIGVEELEEAV